MRFCGVLNDWQGRGCLSSKHPTMNQGRMVLILGDPEDPHRGPVSTREVASLRIVEATDQERADLKQAGYAIPNE